MIKQSPPIGWLGLLILSAVFVLTLPIVVVNYAIQDFVRPLFSRPRRKHSVRRHMLHTAR